MKKKIDFYYRELLKSWGNEPVDKKQVIFLLTDLAQSSASEELTKFEDFVNRQVKTTSIRKLK